MSIRWMSRILLGFALATVPESGLAQPKPPHLGYVYPAGGRIGTTFDLCVGGQFLDGVTNAFITGPDITAKVIDFRRPMPQGQFNKLRDRIQELRQKQRAARREAGTNEWAKADQQEWERLREQVLANPPNRNATAAIADVATVRVTIATNCAPGERELRLSARGGLSNPMKFCLGTLPEFTSPAAQAENLEADRVRRLFDLPARIVSTNIARVTLPTVINGQIQPGEVDRYHFHARQGQQLVVTVSARDLIPYLADAVPGWFQATVAIFDAQGTELAYDDDFQFHPDPVLCFVIPRDGEYTVSVKDAIYRGREDFVYRMAIGELPFVTSIFPLGGASGNNTQVELSGWNLPTNQMLLVPPHGISALPPSGDNWLPQQILFAGGELPEVREKEPNANQAQAQPVKLPVIVNGRVDQPGDVDVFQFEGRAGAVLVAEVVARRLNSPLDSILKVYDAGGSLVAENDDCEDRGSGLNPHHADSQLRVRLPKAGKYFVQLADTQRHGGPEYAYRLRLSAPRPDFELRAVPASLSVRPGSRVPLRVIALRRDGFTNEIQLSLTGPAGFKLSGGRIPGGANETTLEVTAPFRHIQDWVTLQLEGRARLGAGELVRPVVPAEDMMQAFFYRHLVPAQELQLAIIGRNVSRPQHKAQSPREIPN